MGGGYSRIPEERRSFRGCALNNFLPWLVGDIIPFGDLVTDIWLLSTLPLAKPDDYGCSTLAYEYMRKLLAVGTVLSAVPESAILLGIVVGLIGVVVGGLAFLAHRQDGHHISGMAKDLGRYSRYAFADGKATANYLCRPTNHGPQDTSHKGWENTVEVVVTSTMMVAHFPLLLLSRCCRSVEASQRTYTTFVIVQVLAGVLTVTSSIFFAYVLSNAASIMSAAFGIYSLLVGTVIAAKRPRIEDSVVPVMQGYDSSI